MKHTGSVTLFALLFSALLTALLSFHLFFANELFRIKRSDFDINRSERALKNAARELATSSNQLPFFCNERFCVINSTPDTNASYLVGSELPNKAHFPKIDFTPLGKAEIRCQFSPILGGFSKATCLNLAPNSADTFVYGNIKQQNLSPLNSLFLSGSLILDNLSITQQTLIAALGDITVKNITATSPQSITLYSATGAVSIESFSALVRLRVVTWKRGTVPVMQLSNEQQPLLPLLNKQPLMLLPYEAEQ